MGIWTVESSTIRVRLHQIEQVIAAIVQALHPDALVEAVDAAHVAVDEDAGRAVDGDADAADEHRVGRPVDMIGTSGTPGKCFAASAFIGPMILGSRVGGTATGRTGWLAVTVTLAPASSWSLARDRLDRVAGEDAAVDVGGGALGQRVLGVTGAEQCGDAGGAQRRM